MAAIKSVRARVSAEPDGEHVLTLDTNLVRPSHDQLSAKLTP
eukprot:COSAG04_NODE_31146_length_258_cov_0.955975_1_plen_41_part_01